jgi:hypothetical protein
MSHEALRKFMIDPAYAIPRIQLQKRLSTRRTPKAKEDHGEVRTSQTMKRLSPSLRRTAWKFISRPTRIWLMRR